MKKSLKHELIGKEVETQKGKKVVKGVIIQYWEELGTFDRENCDLVRVKYKDGSTEVLERPLVTVVEEQS